MHIKTALQRSDQCREFKISPDAYFVVEQCGDVFLAFYDIWVQYLQGVRVALLVYHLVNLAKTAFANEMLDNIFVSSGEKIFLEALADFKKTLFFGLRLRLRYLYIIVVLLRKESRFDNGSLAGDLIKTLSFLAAATGT